MSSFNTDIDVGKKRINELIETLKNEDGIARQSARNSLVIIGEPALDALIKAFEVKEEPMHWEIAKALSQIGTTKAAKVLVDTLEDHNFSVRWIAAEGLIHIGSTGLIPLLEASHHVIHDLVNRESFGESTRKSLMPVLDALNHFDAVTQTQIAADNALKEIYFK